MTQKITYENYKIQLDLLSIKTRQLKAKLLTKAKKSSFWHKALDYTSKVLLAITSTGGGAQILSENPDTLWITIGRTVLEVVVLGLVTAQGTFHFEKKKQKLYAAASAVCAFNDMVKFQSYQIKGTEGDRMEILKEYRKMYTDIVGTNQIIQTVESVTPQDEYDLERGDSDSVDSIDSAQSSSTDEEIVMRASGESRRPSLMTNERNHLFFVQKMMGDL